MTSSCVCQMAKVLSGRRIFCELVRYAKSVEKSRALCYYNYEKVYAKVGGVSILNQSSFNRETLIQKIRAFRLLDDDFMSKVFEDDIA